MGEFPREIEEKQNDGANNFTSFGQDEERQRNNRQREEAGDRREMMVSVWTISSVPRSFVAGLLRTIGTTGGGNSDTSKTESKVWFFLPPTNRNAAVEISLIVGLGAHF